MRDSDLVAAACILEAFGYEPTTLEAEARAHTGALLLYELVVTVRALAKSMK